MSYPSIAACILSLLVGCSTTSTTVQSATAQVKKAHVEIKGTALTLEEHVLVKLRENKLDASIFKIQLDNVLKDPKKTYEKVITLNLLGFLSKADYSQLYSEKALKSSKKFIRENSRSLHIAEKRYGVSKESIAALLWVETQHGKITGRYPLVQTFISLLMADYPDIVKSLIKEASDRRAADESIKQRFPDTFAFEQKIVDRTKTKSDWAKEQLQAINDIKKSGFVKILLYNGSYAGAFGVPQFIPSTYKDTAISMNKALPPNLYRMPDVILSVANFLKKKGWDEKKPESKSDALYEYNRIRDYGDVILKITNTLKNGEHQPRHVGSSSDTHKTGTDRAPASIKKTGRSTYPVDQSSDRHVR
ncbi:MAG: lytic murein transglycosylase [Bdellovibrionales bacterium]|nr:lytic murein transglycosylase [Bdellovibrionales bacterium]